MAGCRGLLALKGLYSTATEHKLKISPIYSTVHCANALRVVVATESFAAKPYPCACITFLAAIIS
jgi:hypothetical protein